MSPVELPPDLIGKTLPELIKLLAAGDIAARWTGVVRQKIREQWDKKNYGFTPDPETAKELKNITENDAYKRMKECIGPNFYLNIVRLGLRIGKLSHSKAGYEINKFKADVIKKYGDEGIIILNMGSTGVLIPIIQHLSDMKIENDYPQEQMLEFFMKIVHDWNKITIFHQTANGMDDLIDKIKVQMNLHKELFFVFGIGTAGEQAAKGIAQLRKNGTIQKNGYIFKIISRDTDLMQRDHYSWFFKNIYNFEKIVM